MYAEIKSFLHVWCSKRRLSDPNYVAKKLPTAKKEPGLFRVEVYINEYEEIAGAGQGPNIKSAKSAAAVNICEVLINAGHMTQLEYDTKTVDYTKNGHAKIGSKRKAPESNGLDSADDDDLECVYIGKRQRNDENENDPTCASTSQSPPLPPDSEATENGIDPSISKADFSKRHSILSSEIYNYYLDNKQPPEVFDSKLRLLTNFVQCLQQRGCSNFHLFACGSTVTGMGALNCDMDLCMAVYELHASGHEYLPVGRDFSLHQLRFARGAFRRVPGLRKVELIPARVPILRMSFRTWDSRNGPVSTTIEVDVNCNNLAGVYNSHLLHYYCAVDDRLPMLTLVIKQWAEMAGINNAFDGTLSSYALSLMVVHYLQYGVCVASSAPPVLPNLQKEAPELFSMDNDARELRLFMELPEKIRMADGPKNTQSLSELLQGIFDYYAWRFDFKRYTISVRYATAMPKSNETDFIFIEEPFELTNAARSVRTREAYASIIKAFKKASSRFRNATSLDCLF